MKKISARLGILCLLTFSLLFAGCSAGSSTQKERVVVRRTVGAGGARGGGRDRDSVWRPVLPGAMGGIPAGRSD